MQLNYKKYGEAGEHLIILHRLFGMLDNFHTLATRFGQQYQVWYPARTNLSAAEIRVRGKRVISRWHSDEKIYKDTCKPRHAPTA